MFLFIIRLYQLFISPLKPATCRFYPTCSHYATESIKLHGLKGLYIIMKRLIRCHPLSSPKYDPVPVQFNYSIKKGLHK